MSEAIVVPPGEGHLVGNVEFLARTTDTPRFNVGIVTIQAGRGWRHTSTTPKTTRSSSSMAR